MTATMAFWLAPCWAPFSVPDGAEVRMAAVALAAALVEAPSVAAALAAAVPEADSKRNGNIYIKRQNRETKQ